MRRLWRILGLATTLLVTASSFTVSALASGDANHPNPGECSQATEASPGFREYLPDCRAYELVSPPFKNGEPPSALAVSADGGNYAFTSLGAFGEPGNDSTTRGGEYVASRGSASWAARPVNPSGTQFLGGSPDLQGASHETLDFSADLSRTLFLQTPIEAKPVDERFYLRKVADGSFVEVGPVLPRETVSAWTPSVAEGRHKPSTQYSGATEDLSHVFFNQEDLETQPGTWLWPGDHTIDNQSLYEYVGTGNAEPELVGVSNQTSLAAAAATEHKAHINEAAEQISQCGIKIGGSIPERLGGSVETYNAFSASGDTVFFTAIHGPCERLGQTGAGPPVDELYARIDRDRTIAISEPTTGPGGDCGLCDESEPQDALFQGASEDGSKVFFFSTQKLFSGVKGEAGNNLYEYDFGAPAAEKVSFIAPELAPSTAFFSTGLGGVMRVSENGSRVYFVSQAVLAGSAPNEFGAAATAGADNLYAYDTTARDAVFIARLSPEDQVNWNREDENRSTATAADYATPDGRFLLFSSVANLTPDASGEGRQLYRYDATPSREEGEGKVPRLVRITVGARGSYICPRTAKMEDGFNCNGNLVLPPSSFAFSPKYAPAGGPRYSFVEEARPSAVAISSDGARIFFQSPVALTPAALDEKCAYEEFGECLAAEQNVYEWESGHVYLISDGRDTHSLFRFSATQLVGANPSGSDVFFSTADQLGPQDTDTQIDTYDARTGGGFPGTPTSSACQGDVCQGLLGAPPTFGAPSSTTLAGSGNLIPVSPTRAAQKGVKRKTVKCTQSKTRRQNGGKRHNGGKRSEKCAKPKAKSKMRRLRRSNNGQGKK
ncbi:MAG TPA: hypothetical protein VGG98_07830 [Solirubrobacteraceae bacterium]|jgi:hypothetical protein